MPQRFLMEQVLAIRELSQEARRERAIPHGHISSPHVWWTRRPRVVAQSRCSERTSEQR